jgi:hypothetical protein
VQVKVPNHTLFVEKIYNMTETAGAVHEFSITFNMLGGDHTNTVSLRPWYNCDVCLGVMMWFVHAGSRSWSEQLV